MRTSIGQRMLSAVFSFVFVFGSMGSFFTPDAFASERGFLTFSNNTIEWNAKMFADEADFIISAPLHYQFENIEYDEEICTMKDTDANVADFKCEWSQQSVRNLVFRLGLKLATPGGFSDSVSWEFSSLNYPDPQGTGTLDFVYVPAEGEIEALAATDTADGAEVARETGDSTGIFRETGDSTGIFSSSTTMIVVAVLVLLVVLYLTVFRRK